MIPIIVIIIILVKDTGLTLYGCLLVFCWSVSLSVRLSLVSLLVCVSARFLAYVCVRPCVSLLSICSSDCLQRLSVCLSLCPSVSLYVCLSFWLTVSFTLTKDERSKRQLRNSYGDQFTLSTQLIKPNYLVILPTNAALQFLKKLTPSIQ